MHYDLQCKKIAPLTGSRAKSDCLSIKILIPAFIQAFRPVKTNYFLVVSALTVVSATGAGAGVVVSGAGVGAGAVVSVAGASVFEASLQAAKDTDTIAKAKITFFILCFV